MLQHSLLLAAFVLSAFPSAYAEEPDIRIGWIGAMSGAAAKYGAYQAALLALEDVNASGGVGGRKLSLIFQDGKCNSREALSAMNHLVGVEKVRYVVGGHCSPESLPIAPLAERSKTLMMAAITSSPKFSSLGDYVFRVTVPNTDGAKLLLGYLQKQQLNKAAVVYEETEYAQGLAEFFKSEANKLGITVVSYDGVTPGESDFRSIVTRIRSSGAQAVYLSPQSPDSTLSMARAMNDQRLSIPMLGNEVAGNAIRTAGNSAHLFEGMVFAEPEFDVNSQAVRDFEERYKRRFNVDSLPFGFYTCEAYDAVRVVADAIARCGDSPEAVKQCLYDLKGYRGLSGPIAFDRNGDGIRSYTLKKILAGQILAMGS